MYTNPQSSTIVAPSRARLKNPSYQSRLWLAITNVPVSRRQLPEEIVNAFRDFQGDIFEEDGSPYDIPDIDECFGDDPHFRWISLYKKPNQWGNGPHYPTRKWQRLQVLAVFCWIRYPDIARHFDR